MVDDEFSVWEGFQEELLHLLYLLWGDEAIESVDEVTFAMVAPSTRPWDGWVFWGGCTYGLNDGSGNPIWCT